MAAKTHKSFRFSAKTIKQIKYLSYKLKKKGTTDLTEVDTVTKCIDNVYTQARDGYQMDLTDGNV